jgi:hypothetical protein
MTELPTILNSFDIDRNFPDSFDSRKGKQVRVIGKYTQIEARQRPEPPPVYRGHVALFLAEDTAGRAVVFLHPTWHPKAIRPAEEIARYNDQLVVVVGVLVPTTPNSPNFAAHMMGPCMLTIDSINFLTQE